MTEMISHRARTHGRVTTPPAVREAVRLGEQVAAETGRLRAYAAELDREVERFIRELGEDRRDEHR